jgi:hypothetical protein
MAGDRVTYKIGSMVVIENEPDTVCSRCGHKKECRDVLGNGTRICFGCATEAEKNAYARRLFGEESS